MRAVRSPPPRWTGSSCPLTAPSASPAARLRRGGISRALQEATVGLALETVGACDALFQMVLAYVKDRKQFGVPIGSFQAIKHKMSNMFLAVERARSLCYFAVAAINEDTPERATAVSMAKAASDDCQRLVCRESIQSFGGIGFTWEHDCHLFVKRAESGGALFGSAAEHSVAVAGTLGLPPTDAGDDRLASCVPGNRSSPRSVSRRTPRAVGTAAPGWPRRRTGARPAGSAIYFLLLEGEVSAPHRLDATELWHFYDGDPLELRPRVAGRPSRRAWCSGPTWPRVRPPGRRGRRRVAVGAAARPLRARRGDGDAGFHLRRVRARGSGPRAPGRARESGPGLVVAACGWVMITGRASGPDGPERRSQ